MRHSCFKFYWLGIPVVFIFLTSMGWANTFSQPPSLRISQVVVAPDGTNQAVLSPSDGQGKALRGLAASNFQVMEDGREATPLLVVPTQSGQIAISVVLAIDISGSMRGAGIKGAVKGAMAFVDRLGKGDKCALVVFGTGVRQIVDFTDDHERIKKSLAELTASDRQTHLYDAIFQSLDRAGKAPSPRSAVVLLTDGKDEGSLLGTQEVLAKIASREVPIYTLAYGKNVDTEILQRFSAASHGQFYLKPKGSDLSGAYQDIAEELQNDYQLTWNMPEQSTHSHQVTITLLYRGQTVSVSQTANQVGDNPVKESVASQPRILWWPWLVGLGFAVFVFGLFAYRKYSNRAPLEMAKTMVPPRVWFEVVKGADMGQKLIVFDKDAIIGRDSKLAQIILKNDPLAGRKHARMYQNEQGHFVIEDLKSQNGVSVNGVRISEPVTLQPDDHIVIGLTELVFIDQR